MEKFIENHSNFKNSEIIIYDKIKLIKITISNSNKPLVIIPPYSFDGFIKIMETINNDFEIIKKKYNIIYVIFWTEDIKKESLKIIDGITDIKNQYKINENFRINLANSANNIIKKQKIKNFSLLGKSAGGGVAIYITKKNKQVTNLLLICPGILKTNIKLNKEIKIVLSWNIDDDKIPYENCLSLIKNYIKNKNIFKFISFEYGGHELHNDFFKSL
jgi:predicted esterase